MLFWVYCMHEHNMDRFVAILYTVKIPATNELRSTYHKYHSTELHTYYAPPDLWQHEILEIIGVGHKN